MDNEEALKFFNSLMDAPDDTRWSAPATLTINIDNVVKNPVCRKNIGHFKIYVDKYWTGNHFGYTSIYYIVDTTSEKVKADLSDSFSSIVYLLGGAKQKRKLTRFQSEY